MLAAFLMGLVGGQRSMTPLATVAVAAARGELPADNGAPALLAGPAVAAGAVLLAAAEMAGDKMKSAPDRTVFLGLAARLLATGLAGTALVPRRQRWLGAAVAATTAVAASFPGWRARMKMMTRVGQTTSGVVEDGIVVAAAATAVHLR